MKKFFGLCALLLTSVAGFAANSTKEAPKVQPAEKQGQVAQDERNGTEEEVVVLEEDKVNN